MNRVRKRPRPQEQFQQTVSESYHQLADSKCGSLSPDRLSLLLEYLQVAAASSDGEISLHERSQLASQVIEECREVNALDLASVRKIGKYILDKSTRV